MRGAMLLLASGCVAIGLAPVVFWPAIARAVGDWQPAWAGSAVPEPLYSLGKFHIALAVLAPAAVWWVWRRIVRCGVVDGLTWDCGYAVPTARMQYTAGSFAGIVTEWFAWILRPQRHEHRPAASLPGNASWTEHTPETVLEQIVQPAGAMVMRVSTGVRRLQHGRVQFYLFYLLVGVLALALLIALGGGK